MFKRVREISYDSAVFRGRGLEARYSTNTGVELRVRSELDGLEPEALASVDVENYAKLWGLAMFGHLFWPLLPTRVHVKALSLEPDEEERWRSWFVGVLSENFYRSGNRAALDLTFSGEPLAARQSGPRLAERAILMSGGGKDSVVSGELLKGLGVPFSWFSSRGKKMDPAVRKVAEISGDFPLVSGESFFESRDPGHADFEEARLKRLRPVYLIRRKRLRGLRFLSLISQTLEACLVAEATASRYVVAGNERSANEGNGIRIGDLEVNHQYMKSYAFEREFSPFLSRYLHPELKYMSVLMPFYELQIGKIFASYPQYFHAFRSCNRRTAEAPWCCECPKCASVFLMLAAFIDEEVVSRIFNADLLADPKLVDTFMALCGRRSHKPLECVGQQDESLLALYLASKRRKATPLHPDLAAILPEAAQVAELQSRILDAYGNENGLPPHWQEQLRRMIG